MKHGFAYFGMITVVITPTKDADGNNVIVPFVINSSAKENSVWVASNEIKSVYGKDDLRGYINKYVGLGALERKKIRPPATSGVQFPGGGSNPSVVAQARLISNNKLPQTEPAVNSYSMQEPEIDAQDQMKIVGDGDVDVALPSGYDDIQVAITGEDSAAPNRYSLMSLEESALGKDRYSYIKRLAKATGVSTDQAAEWVDSVYSVAAIIGDDKTRLDYAANRANTSLKPNSEYDFSLDFSTLCAKRLLFTGTMDAIQEALPNTPLTSEDFVHIREMMKDSGYEVACGICYVESTRREFSTISEGFIEQYKKAVSDGTNIKKVNTAGAVKDLVTSKGVENRDPNRFVYPEEWFT